MTQQPCSFSLTITSRWPKAFLIIDSEICFGPGNPGGPSSDSGRIWEESHQCALNHRLGPGWSWSVDLGIYCLQFISMAFGGQKPKKISAVGSHYETGMDDTVTVLLQYPGGVHGSFTCSITVLLSNTVSVSGTKGLAQILSPCWCLTRAGGEGGV
ncbi:hypothetical protein CB1_001183015 [Camelus ferus]|nr:hypothetical protein CB1_001183015 [Camelus ferus]